MFRSVEDVKNLVNIAERIDGMVTIASDRYCANAKSIIGVYVLDFCNPMYLEVEKWKDEYEAMLEPYRF